MRRARVPPGREGCVVSCFSLPIAGRRTHRVQAGGARGSGRAAGAKPVPSAVTVVGSPPAADLADPGDTAERLSAAGGSEDIRTPQPARVNATATCGGWQAGILHLESMATSDP